MALKDALITRSPQIDPYAAGDYVGFGVALIRTANRVCKGAKDDNDESLIGFSVQPADNVALDKDGFYQASNNGAVPDIVRVVRKGTRINALVIAKSNTDIVDGDFLEVAPLGDASCYIGVLNEAGSNAGDVRTITSVFQAEEDVTIGSSTYKTPVSVAVGDGTITLSSANLALLNLQVGGYIVLEDVNGKAQLNSVKALSATVISLMFPSTVALTSGNSDLVYKVFQVKGIIL